MADFSEYGRGRLGSTEKRVGKVLIDKVNSSNLSKEFKDGFKVSMSAKYQKPTLIVPKTNDIELGKFEYDVLRLWAEKEHTSWEWGDERDTYYVIDWDAE